MTRARCVRRSRRPRGRRPGACAARTTPNVPRYALANRPAKRQPLLAKSPCASQRARRAWKMTYVVVESCIKCKYMDCVEVCPVDCFYKGENMLVIHPDECIDCGVCEPECPADAIKPDTEPGLEKRLGVNAEYAKTWPNITQKKESPPDAKEFEGQEGKFEKYFSKESGTGD